ncbi:hypothetical protein ACFFX0_17025 [Citricoccus parietis]|uniref:Uncharacterized protein n=1 Tax=Citricoccus parietis TaxID=592307 RepID=A0ABV5G1K0_9MICC
MDGHGWGSLGWGPQRWASGSGDIHQKDLEVGPALRFLQDGKGPGRGSSAGCGQRGGGVGQMNGGDSWPRQKDAGRGVATVLRVISIDHQFPHLLQMSPSADEERKSRQGSAPNPDGSGHHWRLVPDLWRATPLPVSSLRGNKKLAVETAPVSGFNAGKRCDLDRQSSRGLSSRKRAQRSISPRMKASTSSWASSSWCWTGGDFMK